MISEPTKEEQAEFDRLFERMEEKRRLYLISPQEGVSWAEEGLRLARVDFGDWCLEHRGKTFTLPGEGDKE